MSTVYRINVCVPADGWLSKLNLRAREYADDLAWQWERAAAVAATAAMTPPMKRVVVRALVRVPVREMKRRVIVAEDIRPSLGAALHGLVAAGVLTGSDRRYVVADSLELGVSTGDLEPLLVLELTEVSGG